MVKKYNIAVVGATGNVGREILNILHEREFPVDKVYALASSRSAGTAIEFGDDEVIVEDLEYFDFSKADIGLFSPGASISKVHAPRAAKAGCVVIDNTSHFRMEEGIPLIVPEVNAHAIAGYKQKNIIANPNCSTIQMVLVLKALEAISPIKRVIVSTYQSVSGGGKDAMDELFEQTRATYNGDITEPKNFTKRIAFNVIPHIDKFMDGEYAGYTKEEWKMIVETKKIMGSDIAVSATCVRVPVFVSHAESINVEFEKDISENDAFMALKSGEGIEVLDGRFDGEYSTPYDASGKDITFVSRVRKDNTNPKALNLWVVSDNLRKGAALNAVQIAEELIKNHI